jgi:hypothetical protein
VRRHKEREDSQYLRIKFRGIFADVHAFAVLMFSMSALLQTTRMLLNPLNSEETPLRIKKDIKKIMDANHYTLQFTILQNPALSF